MLSRYTLNNNNKYLLKLTVLTSMLSRYTLNNNNKYLLTLTVLTSMLSRYTLNNNNKYLLTLAVLTSNNLLYVRVAILLTCAVENICMTRSFSKRGGLGP